MNPFSTIEELRLGLREKQFSAKELTLFYLDRTERLNPQINSFITIDEAGALEAASVAEERLLNADAHPLCGIPIAHKDLFCAQDKLTTCASKMLSNFVAPYDATVVQQAKQAGMVMLGKTNMDEFAMGSSNETSHFGAVHNPWKLGYAPGGSSGGSAAAVAAGMTPIATGTDTGGSIRQPSSLCGVTGLKPTYGRVSRFGMIAFASSLDQGGPIGRCVEDVAALLSVIQGGDPHDATSAEVTDSLELDADRRFTIGIPEHLFEGLDGRIANLINDAWQSLQTRGHTVKSVDLPYTDEAVAAYYVLSGAEASTNLARYDGVRYGHRTDSPVDLADLYCKSRSEGFGLEVKRRILTGTYSLSVGYYDAYYLKAQKIRRLVRDAFLSMFNDVDLIIAPVAPTPAFKLGSLANNPVEMYRQDLYTIPSSLAGVPAMSLPCGFVDGLPVGMQVIGPHFKDGDVLSLGKQYQLESDWHTRHPELEIGEAA